MRRRDLEEWAEDGDLVLARTVRVDGKGGARLGGHFATVRALGELGARLAEVHGQHQCLRLLEPSTQTAFLDRFQGGEHLGRSRAAASRPGACGRSRSPLEALRRDARDRARELDLLAYQVREIEEADPGSGETPALETEAARLGHVERLRELVGDAERTIAGEAGAADLLAGVQAALGAVDVPRPRGRGARRARPRSRR